MTGLSPCYNGATRDELLAARFKAFLEADHHRVTV
jgi:hypothetical protein